MEPTDIFKMLDNIDPEKMLKEAVEINEKLNREMSQHIDIGEAGGGLVKVYMNGLKDLVDIEMDPTLEGEKLSLIKDLTIAAFNIASKKIETYRAEKGMHTNLLDNVKLPEKE